MRDVYFPICLRAWKKMRPAIEQNRYHIFSCGLPPSLVCVCALFVPSRQRTRETPRLSFFLVCPTVVSQACP